MKDPAKIADSKKVMQNLKVLEKSRGPLERTLITLVTNTPQVGAQTSPISFSRIWHRMWHCHSDKSVMIKLCACCWSCW